MVAFRPNPSDHDLELLSAYLDGELSDRATVDLERRLRREPALSAALEELQATITLLRELPLLKAPRDFTLDPVLYGRPAPWWQRLFTLTNMLQLSGALGTVASVLLIVGALVLGGTVNQTKESRDAAAPPVAVQYTLDAVQGETFTPLSADESFPTGVPPVAQVPTETSVPAADGMDVTSEIALGSGDVTAIAYSGEGLFQATVIAQSTFYSSTDTWDTSTAVALDHQPTFVPAASGLPPVIVEESETNQSAEQPSEAEPSIMAETYVNGETDSTADFGDSNLHDEDVLSPAPDTEALGANAPSEPAALQVAPGANTANDDAAASASTSEPQAVGETASTGAFMREPEKTPVSTDVQPKLPTSAAFTPPSTATLLPSPTTPPPTARLLPPSQTPFPTLESSSGPVVQAVTAPDENKIENEAAERARSNEENQESRWLVWVGVITLLCSLAALAWGRLRMHRT